MKHAARVRTAAITIAIILASLAFHYFGAAGLWDIGISDRLNQRESVTDKNIYIIGIDDKTLEKYGPVNTWSREIPAKLVELLSADGAKPAVIGFDIIYSEQADEQADNQFADACQETDENGKVTYNPYHVDYVIEPYESLRGSAVHGYANTTVDADGYVRQAMAYIDYEGERAYSLSSQVYKMYQESRGEEAIFPATYGRSNRFYFTSA